MRTTQRTRIETAIFKDRLIIDGAAQTLEQTTPFDENTALFQRNAVTPSEGKIRPLSERGHVVFVAPERAEAAETAACDDKSSCRFHLYGSFKGNLCVHSRQKLQRGSHSAVLWKNTATKAENFSFYLPFAPTKLPLWKSPDKRQQELSR